MAGTNNSYHVAHCTKYAEDWNNHKVLENYSVHYAFILLSDPQCNFTEDWSVHKFQRLRRLVISLVLATDFADHFECADTPLPPHRLQYIVMSL
jgi:hypothetical protein